ncbi:MAG: FtsW/RodA/SpoVE family cell cycle protein [Lachnospiraceae bacterium]|nr:FtsW/RodA/SpoVE family cell cycle protein [Lachnospiraceae bacterium]
MQEYVIELSKYFINILMIVYTLTCFYAFRYRMEKERKGVYIVQTILMFLIQILSFVNLTMVGKDIQYLFFFLFILLFLFASVTLVPMIYENINRFLLNNMCMLLGVGLCIVSRLSFQKAIRQYIIVLASLTISLFIPFLMGRIHFFKKLTWLYAAVGISLLSTVLILGEVTHGSKISFSLGGITFQPSEFVKILYVFFLAGALWEKTSFGRVVLTAILAGMHVIVLVVSKDLGSALIFFIGFVFVVFVATRNYLYLLLGALGGSAAALVAFQLFSHIRTRVLAWQDPWSYIDNQGYQITQSLFAVGSGSWFGMGLLKGNPTAIPYVEADFIFSSICEELGVIFGICLILICVSCFIMMMYISTKIFDRFYQLIVYGIGIMYIFQIFLTVGGGIKFIPLTGVTLPFISYGGSSVMTTMIMFFIIQGIYIRLHQEREKYEYRKKRAEQSEG